MSRYFIMYDDVSLPGRWELGNPMDRLGRRVDPWQFDTGQSLPNREELIFPLRRPGHGLDFCEAGFAIPLASQRLMNLIQRLGVADVQFLPARVEKRKEPYFVLNATRLVDCIDEGRSLRAERWKPEDGHPERTGEYRVIEGMRIDSTKVGGAHFFRTWGWPVLVVSEDIRQAMEQEALTGPRFVEV